MSNKSTILLLILSFSVFIVDAQKDDRLAQGLRPIQQVALKTFPTLDNQQLFDAEMKRRAVEQTAVQFAHPFEVDIRPDTHGEWETDANGLSVWRYRLQSKGAKSLNLGFNQFYLPAGATLMLYSEDYSIIRGPYTPSDNDDHAQFWTPIIPTDQLVVEVRLPADKRDQLQLQLNRVNHDFVGFMDRSVSSGSCNLDVICGAADGFPEVENYRDIIRSVAVYSFGGFNICTGFLVNNTAQDGTPYFMTADHCGLTASQAPSLVVYWNYENSTCRQPGSAASGGAGDGSLDDFNSGSIFRATYDPSDFTLVELDDPVSETANAFLAGWNREDIAPTSSIAIHHPGTEEKRISFENDPSFISGYLDNTADPNSTHIRVADWDEGTTEGGSSGSPLFDQNKHVVGQLHGGFAACGNDDPDWYGRFFRSWEGGGTPQTRLKDWLDPGQTGVVVLDGKDLSFSLTANESKLERCAPDAAIFEIEVSENFTNPVNLTATSNLQDLPGEELILSQSTANPGSTFTLEVVTAGQMSGIYNISVVGNDGIDQANTELTLALFAGIPAPPVMTAPMNGETDVPISPVLSWTPDLSGTSYSYQLATDVGFGNIVASGNNLNDTSVSGLLLDVETTYFWRVRAANLCGEGPWSNPFTFTTSGDACATLPSADIPLPITDSGTPIVTSNIFIDLPGSVLELSLENLEILHTWIGDLEAYLTSPSGTQIELFNRPGVPNSNFGCGEDNMLLSFSDAASNTNADFENTCQTSGSYGIEGAFQPVDPFSTFEGESIQGNWTLTIVDNENFDGGSLLNWSLAICAAESSVFINPGADTIFTCLGDPGFINLDLNGFTSNASLTAAWSGPNSNTILGFSSPQVDLSSIPPSSSFDLFIDFLANPEPGTYELTVTVVDGDMNEASTSFVLIVYPGAIAPDLIQPTDGSTNVNTDPLFQWAAIPPQTAYTFEIATDPDFMNIVETKTSMFPQLSLNNSLEGQTTYYWRVTSVADFCSPAVSEVFSFTTEMTSQVQNAFDTEIEIFPNPTADRVQLRFAQALSGPLQIQLYNGLGQRLENRTEQNPIQVELDLKAYAAGPYIIYLTYKGETLVQKVWRME